MRNGLIARLKLSERGSGMINRIEKIMNASNFHDPQVVE
jgi:hypothetical protein